MKGKLLNFLLIVTSLFGYLEWGTNMHTFLFQAEGEILSKLTADPMSVLHPLTVLPMLGQIGLLVTLFQKQPERILTYCCIGSMGILFLLMFAIGVMSFNLKIIASTLPFLILSFLAIRYHRASRRIT